MNDLAKAITALTRLNDEGWQCQITPEIVESLYTNKLIDFSSDGQGWNLTAEGQAILAAI